MNRKNYLAALSDIPDTPKLIFIEDVIRTNVELMQQATRSIQTKIYFALKACYHLPILRILKRMNVGAEIMTEMEWDLAVSAGFKGGQTICNGLGRSTEFLCRAVNAGSTIILDSYYDLQRLKSVACNSNSRCEVGIRIKPDVSQFQDNPYARHHTKLGIPPESDLFATVLQEIGECEFLNLTTLHANFSINESSTLPHLQVMRQLAQVKRHIESRFKHIKIRFIDLGGGFLTNDSPAKSRALFLDLAENFNAHFPDSTLLLEPGRFLINNAGFVLAAVTDIKTVGTRQFIISDATTNVLIPIPTANYTLLRPKPSSVGLFTCTLADGITSPHNIIIDEVQLLRMPKVGARLILGNCGAYTQAMSEFWAYEPFPVALLTSKSKVREILTKQQIARARKILLGI